MKEIRKFLKEELKLELNSKMIKLRVVSSGIDFLGYIVRKDYILVRRRVVNNMEAKLRYFKRRGLEKLDYDTAEDLRSSLQSYLGHFKWANSYRLRENLLKRKIISDHFVLIGNRLARKYGLNREFEAESLKTQPDFFKGDFLKGAFISKAFDRVKDFNSRKFPVGIVISGNPFGKILGSYACFLKSYVKGVYFRVVCNAHLGISFLLKIVNVNSYHHNLILSFRKNWPDLFSFVRFVIPGLIKMKILTAFQSAQVRKVPFRSFDSRNYFFFSGSAKNKLAFGMFAEPNWFNMFFHSLIIPYSLRNVNTAYDVDGAFNLLVPLKVLYGNEAGELKVSKLGQ